MKMAIAMTKTNAEEVSLKLKGLLDELTALEVHLVILASFTNHDGSVVFGVETNTSERVAASLLKAGSMRIGACTAIDDQA